MVVVVVFASTLDLLKGPIRVLVVSLSMGFFDLLQRGKLATEFGVHSALELPHAIRSALVVDLSRRCIGQRLVGLLDLNKSGMGRLPLVGGYFVWVVLASQCSIRGFEFVS